jgi:hypothetical protein
MGRNSDRLVHVFPGVYEHHLALAGTSVLEARTRLPYRLPYFAHAIVNDKPVLVHHILRAGDLLTFLRPPGFKASGRRKPSAKAEARSLLSAYPEVTELAKTIQQEADEGGWDNHKIIEMITARFVRWCEDNFGPNTKEAPTRLDEIIRQATCLKMLAVRQRPGRPPKKPGRKNTTADLADFADARHADTWKEIAAQWNQKHPNRRVNSNNVRDAWRRRYGDKAIPSKKNRGEG